MIGGQLLLFRIRLLKAAVVVLILAGSGQFGIGQELKEFDADYLQSPPAGPELDQVVSAIIRSTNELRKAEGREPLKTNNKLTRAAQYFAAKAEDLTLASIAVLEHKVFVLFD